MPQFDFYNVFVQIFWLTILFISCYVVYTRFYIKGITEVRLLRTSIMYALKCTKVFKTTKSTLYDFVLKHFKNKK